MSSPGAYETYLYPQAYVSVGDWSSIPTLPSSMYDNNDGTRMTAKSTLGGNNAYFSVINIPGMSDGATIDEVGQWVRPMYGTIRFGWYHISPAAHSSYESQYNWTGAGQWYFTFPLNPAGNPWTGTDFISSNLRLYNRPMTSTMLLTEWRPVVYWFPPSGGYSCFFGCLGPLVGIALSQMPEIAKEIFRRTGTRLSPLMYARAYREFKAQRFPKHFDLHFQPCLVGA